MLKDISFSMEFLKGHYDSSYSFQRTIVFECHAVSNEILFKEHYLSSNMFKGHYFSKYVLSKRKIFFERHFCQKTLSLKKHYLSNDFFQRTLVFKYWFLKDIIL